MNHVPVLLDEVVELTKPTHGDVVLDGTLGAGNYTARLLSLVGDTGKVIAFDQDEEAIHHAQDRFSREIASGQLELKHASFVSLQTELATQEIDVAVFDLGLSTHQLDTPQRGFSFRFEAPLDMRFGTSGQTAAQLLARASVEDLIYIFHGYGELWNAHKLAKRIVERRRLAPIETTLQLVELAESVAAPRKADASYFAQVFQAIRIAVNDEMRALEELFAQEWWSFLKIGGRMAVVSYHSLEDRVVKRAFVQAAKECECPAGSPICTCHKQAYVKLLHKKPITPSETERDQNSRARSAKLRGIQRIR